MLQGAKTFKINPNLSERRYIASERRYIASERRYIASER